MKSQKKYSKIISCILAVMMIVCIFAACTNQTNEPSNTNSGTEANGTSSERKQKDTLIVVKSEDVSSLDPSKIVNQKSFTIYSQIFEGLVRFNPRPRPWSLALQPSGSR